MLPPHVGGYDVANGLSRHAALFAGVSFVTALGAGTTFVGAAGDASVEELATPTMLRAD